MTVNPHFTSNGKTPTGTCGLCTCKIEIATKMDFDFLLQMSFDLCVFFFFSPYFLFLSMMQYTRLLPLFAQKDGVPLHSVPVCLTLHFPFFRRLNCAGSCFEKGGWKLLTGLAVGVSKAPCPIVCITTQSIALNSLARLALLSLWSASRYWSMTYQAGVQNSYQILAVVTAGLAKTCKSICLRVDT